MDFPEFLQKEERQPKQKEGRQKGGLRANLAAFNALVAASSESS